MSWGPSDKEWAGMIIATTVAIIFIPGVVIGAVIGSLVTWLAMR